MFPSCIHLASYGTCTSFLYAFSSAPSGMSNPQRPAASHLTPSIVPKVDVPAPSTIASNALVNAYIEPRTWRRAALRSYAGDINGVLLAPDPALDAALAASAAAGLPAIQVSPVQGKFL